MQVLTIPVYDPKDDVTQSVKEAADTGLFDVISISYYMGTAYRCVILLFNPLEAAKQWWTVDDGLLRFWGQKIPNILKAFTVNDSFEVGVARKLENLEGLHISWDTSREQTP